MRTSATSNSGDHPNWHWKRTCNEGEHLQAEWRVIDSSREIITQGEMEERDMKHHRVDRDSLFLYLLSSFLTFPSLRFSLPSSPYSQTSQPVQRLTFTVKSPRTYLVLPRSEWCSEAGLQVTQSNLIDTFTHKTRVSECRRYKYKLNTIIETIYGKSSIVLGENQFFCREQRCRGW